MEDCKICGKKRDMSQTVLSGHIDLCNDCGLEEIAVYRVFDEDMGWFIHSELNEAIESVKAEFENAECGNVSITISTDKMTRGEYMSLPEFKG